LSLHAQLHKYLRVLPEWRFAPPRVKATGPLRRFGSECGGYCLDESLVSSGSVVYSLGIGEDISFDLSLIARVGAEIHAFDPTPRVASWLAAQSLPKTFHFHPSGIAGHDGHETFYLPPRAQWISHSLLPARQYSVASIILPVTRLSTAMRSLGHRNIDVLKMDIEGAEYAVIDEIVRARIPVGQLLVEFHHRLSTVGISKTKRALAALESHGMKISYICPRKEVFTLVARAEIERRGTQLPAIRRTASPEESAR
jgi:FkbM family methyltransferase